MGKFPVLALMVLVGAGATAGLGDDAAAAGSTSILFRAGTDGFFVGGGMTPGVWVVDPAVVPGVGALPGVAGCWLDVGDGNRNGRIDGIDVLNEAAASGCISGWEASFDGCFVAELDGVRENPDLILYWLVYVNQAFSPVGICDMALQDGDHLGWRYSGMLALV